MGFYILLIIDALLLWNQSNWGWLALILVGFAFHVLKEDNDSLNLANKKIMVEALAMTSALETCIDAIEERLNKDQNN